MIFLNDVPKLFRKKNKRYMRLKNQPNTHTDTRKMYPFFKQNKKKKSRKKVVVKWNHHHLLMCVCNWLPTGKNNEMKRKNRKRIDIFVSSSENKTKKQSHCVCVSRSILFSINQSINDVGYLFFFLQLIVIDFRFPFFLYFGSSLSTIDMVIVDDKSLLQISWWWWWSYQDTHTINQNKQSVNWISKTKHKIQ